MVVACDGDTVGATSLNAPEKKMMSRSIDSAKKMIRRKIFRQWWWPEVMVVGRSWSVAGEGEERVRGENY